ncbi:MAG: hypothetical protein CSB47_09030 [Proteobacteria bacterium]|nr:MAG: hypothetical protein CSB47_09030 [Pseudomonadota bacterium]
MNILNTNRYTKKKLALPAISFAVCSALITGCFNHGNGNTTTLPPDTEPFAKDTLLSIQVLDTKGDPVKGAEVRITSDPSDVIPNAEEKQLTKDTPAGLVTYAPKEFSGSKILQVIASKEGFLSNNMPLEVRGGKANEASIVITNIASNSTEGISTKTVTANSDKKITVTAKEGDGDGDSQTTVVIDSDPGAKTKDNKPLGKELSVVVAQYDFDENEALDAFPGGFSVSIENPGKLLADSKEAPPTDKITPTDGEVVFESAGFTAIEVKDSEGNVAKSFNKPVQISTRVNPNFINPVTKEKIKLGERIPIWSFEASTGKWSYEGTGEVKPGPNGTLKVDYDVKHLSYYNLDYFGGGRCNATVTFMDTNGSTHALSGRVASQGWTHTFKYPGDESLILRNAPADRLVTFENLKTVTGQNIDVIDPSGPINLCAPDNSHTVLIKPPQVEYSELTASANTYCSNDSSVADKPIKGTYIRIYTEDWAYVGSAKTKSSGETSFRLPLGSYRVSMYDVAHRKNISKKVTLTSTETGSVALRVPQTCKVTTGGSSTGG